MVAPTDAAGYDIFDLIKADTDALTRAFHRHAEQVIGTDVR
jgi:hypothetical protein